MKRMALSVSKDGSAVTFKDGWRKFNVPSFTLKSMSYGAAASANDEASSSTNTDMERPNVGSDGCEQPSADDAYAEVLSVLSRQPDDSFSLSRLNPWLLKLLMALSFNAYFCSQNEARRAEMQRQMAFSFELIIGWLLRLFNQKCWVLPIIVLSLWFLRCKAPGGVWDVGSKFRLIYSKRTTEMIAIDLGNNIQQPCYFPTWASRKVALVVFDNCLPKFGTSYEGARDMGDGSWHYLFINWFLKPMRSTDVPLDFDPNEAETFSVAAANFPAAQWLADDQARQQHLFISWYESIASVSSAAGIFGVLKHPSEESHGRDHFIYQNHVGTDNGTAGYSDVRKVLAQIRLTVVCALSIPIVFVLGDQQSFSRMVWLKRKEPQSYSFVIPWYGDFHFAVHLLMAMHMLWWKVFMRCLTDETGFCSASLNEEWSSVELYNRYRFAYEATIVGILAYLLEVLPDGALNDPASLMEAARVNNGGLEVILRFLFDFGLPWLLFRQSIRRGDSSAMDEMHKVAVKWFRTTNKHQYARICVDYAYLLMNLNPALLQLWSKYRTCSWVGNDGHNIAWDQANEIMNLDVKKMKPTDPARIDKVITVLNGLRAADLHLRQTIGLERGGGDDYTPVKPHHVQLIVDVLEKKLGVNTDEVFPQQPKTRNPFGIPRRPWVDVKNPSGLRSPTDEDLANEAEDWAIKQLETAPFPGDK